MGTASLRATETIPSLKCAYSIILIQLHISWKALSQQADTDLVHDWSYLKLKYPIEFLRSNRLKLFPITTVTSFYYNYSAEI